MVSTTLVSLFWSSILFLCGALLFQKSIAHFLEVDKEYVNYAIWILALDALVILPFSELRAEQKPIRYAVIKLFNVFVNMFLSLFFLIVLPDLAYSNPHGFWSSIFIKNRKKFFVYVYLKHVFMYVLCMNNLV